MAEETNSEAIPALTLESVCKIMREKVLSFTIESATAPGDNYMSVLYNLKCELEGQEMRYGIAKCYPSHPTRQQFLNKSNIFWKELCIYKEFIPTLKEFYESQGVEMRLPFAPLISGQAIDFKRGRLEYEEMIAKYSDKILSPFENYIMMVDLKNTYEFRMANRLVGLNVDEVSLVMTEHSKLHALSWAYKVKHNIQELSQKMPYLKHEMNSNDPAPFIKIMEDRCQNALDTLKKIPGVDPGILEGVVMYKCHIAEIVKSSGAGPATSLEKFYRVKPVNDEATRQADELPWRTVIHGDCWVNNLLFCYDEVTNKAIELALVDLQMCEACPTMDLVYMMYTSTTAEFRQNHLDEMLKLYSANFKSYCDQLGLEYLPGFSFEALKRRFHACRLKGLNIALMALPDMLKESKDAQDLDRFKADANITDMMTVRTEGFCENKIYYERLLGICEELYREGVI